MAHIKDVKDYEGRYLVTSDGFVFGFHKDIILKAITIINTGYARVNFNKDGKQKMMLVHRLVASTFISNPKNKKYVNHKDSDILNNDVSNLEWVTNSENVKHALDSGRRKRQKLLCVALDLVFEGHKQASVFINKSLACIASAIKRNCKAGGYTWKRV